jgi:hypothetical protein
MLAVQAFVNAAVFGVLAWFFMPVDSWIVSGPLFFANLLACMGFLLGGVLALTLRLRWPVVACWLGLIGFFGWYNLLAGSRTWGLFEGGFILLSLAAYLLAGLIGAIWLPLPTGRMDLFSLGRPEWADEGRRQDL